jgi:hypothetical protein
MVLKNIFVASLCATLLVWGAPSVADEYRPDEFLSLDLSKAVLSPKPIGPRAQFAPVAIEAKADPGSDRPQARMEPKGHPKIVVRHAAVPRTSLAHVRSGKPHGAVATRLARPHGNPLDAQARDTRIQVWPCKSGGICDWQREQREKE